MSEQNKFTFPSGFIQPPEYSPSTTSTNTPAQFPTGEYPVPQEQKDIHHLNDNFPDDGW